jgi:poly(hydroxyalkanoate) depolymerase family esterase
MNAKTLTARGVALLLASAPLSASGGEFVHKTFSAKAYSGSRERRYQVFVPSAYNGRDAVPMVMVLHGCKQTEQNMINETRFKELAERENFIVVYPFITSYDETRGPNCWGFWFHQHIHEGAGEVEDLYGIGREVEATFKIDPERRYVTGLSSGAGMSVALAVARSEYFAAAGAAAGLPYSERSSSIGLVCANPGIFQSISAAVEAMRKEQKSAADRRVIPIMTIHSRNDCTVNPKASEIIRDSWLRRYGVSEAVTATSDCSQEGVACTQTKYGPAGQSVVETVVYNGARGGFLGNGSHYWVGDNAGEFANPNGPSAAQLFWEFFKRHSFSENQPPSATGAPLQGGTPPPHQQPGGTGPAAARR